MRFAPSSHAVTQAGGRSVLRNGDGDLRLLEAARDDPGARDLRDHRP
ncbi:hypothetical protein [Methylobacterium radiotolerans]